MAKLSKEAITKIGERYLKDSGKDSVLVTEDGSIFLPENERYARNHGATLQAKDRNYGGSFVTVKKGPKAKAKAAEATKGKAAKKAKK